MKRTFVHAIFLVASALLSQAAWADPPARVGRVAFLAGAVSHRAAGDADWSPAGRNEPVTSGDSFWTEPDARAELAVGSTAFRLDGGTELEIGRLDDTAFEATLLRGTVNIRLRTLAPDESYSLATPRGTVVLAAAGTYHVEAGDDRAPTRLAVFRGRALLFDRGSTTAVGPGRAAQLGGGPGAPIAAIVPAAPTEFDDWALARDGRDGPPPSLAYVPPGTTGYEDLDRYGDWQPDPQYGPVWYPAAVPVGWAPYRVGHWRWVAPWGWTWVDDAPWGFAPFHYGRWALVGERWGWVPGRLVARPVYAPALVAFVGGADWGAGFAPGRAPCVGWVPLAPREAFHPAYAASPIYVRNVNIAHVTNITVIQGAATNAGFANHAHATVVPRAAFVAARPVAPEALAVPAHALVVAPVADRGPAPERARAEDRHEHPRAALPGRPAPTARDLPGRAEERPRAAADHVMATAPAPPRHDIDRGRRPDPAVARPQPQGVLPPAAHIAQPPPADVRTEPRPAAADLHRQAEERSHAAAGRMVAPPAAPPPVARPQQQGMIPPAMHPAPPLRPAAVAQPPAVRAEQRPAPADFQRREEGRPHATAGRMIAPQAAPPPAPPPPVARPQQQGQVAPASHPAAQPAARETTPRRPERSEQRRD